MRYSQFKKFVKKYEFWCTGEILHEESDLENYHPENSKLIKLIRDKRSKKVKGLWKVYPLAVDRHHVYIACPHCGKVHIHGANKDGYAGVRVPHCVYSKPNYEIVDVEST
jgi:predicted RNA-binding Zn-ribbon protein involved in translation (DUF1610 family)